MTTADIRTYSELVTKATFADKVEYLKLNGTVGADTFGYDRIVNQMFYRSREWKRIRDQVIVRDGGCDLGDPDRPISGRVYIHHMNPITIEDITRSSENLMNPEYLVCTSFDTHNLIHYGDISNVRSQSTERSPNDTCPWRQTGGNTNGQG